MKTYKILLLLTMALSVITIQAQTQDMKYRRSSLQLLVFEQGQGSEYKMTPQQRRLVQECENEFAWELHQNFNDHTCMPIYVDCYDKSEEWDVDDQKMRTHYKYKIEFQRGFSWVSGGKELDQYLQDDHVAEKLIAKWFNQSSDKVNGSYYNMDLIQERGAYDASQLDRLRSKESVRGENILKDAGMDLIPNTFVVCVRLSFKKESGSYLPVRDLSHTVSVSSVNRSVQKPRSSYTTGQREYYVEWTLYADTYLYQLEWTEKESNLFMSKYYFSDPKQLLASNDFHLKYIDGYTTSTSYRETKRRDQMSREGQGAWYTDSEKLNIPEEWTSGVLKKSIYQVLHDNMVELQARNEGFEIKAPLIDVDTKKKYATAFIGKKEGLGNRDQFEVLMPKYDEKNNIFRYVPVGMLEVDPKRIWDNTKDNSNQEIDRTYFKGVNKKMAPGMILKQIVFTKNPPLYHPNHARIQTR